MFDFIDLNIQIKLVRAFISQVKQIKSHIVSICLLINLTSIELKLKRWLKGRGLSIELKF